MPRKKIVFYRNGMSGGTATLSYRIGKKFIESGYDVEYVYERLNDINNYNLFINSGIIVNTKITFKKNINEYINCIFMTYSLEEHCEASYFLRNNENVLVLCYPVCNGISGSEPQKIEKIRFIGKWITRRYFKKIYKENLIFFTSGKSENKYLNYYKTKKLNNIIYCPIPIECPPFEVERINQTYKSKEKIILSFLRNDFPLKGYVFPLISSFNKIVEDGENNYKLLLVISGEDISRVKNYVASISNKNYISIINGVSYERLQAIIKDSYLNVGHGTSILDSAIWGVPSLLAVDMTEEDVCCGFFDGLTITGKQNFAKGDYYCWLKKAIDLSYLDYFNLCKNTHFIISNNYSVDSFFKIIYENHSFLQKKKTLYIWIYYLKIMFDKIIKSIIKTKRR